MGRRIENLEGLSEIVGEPVYGVPELAKKLDRSTGWVNKMRRAGKLKGVFVGGQEVFTQSHVLALIMGSGVSA
jgi:hypothetical protein